MMNIPSRLRGKLSYIRRAFRDRADLLWELDMMIGQLAEEERLAGRFGPGKKSSQVWSRFISILRSDPWLSRELKRLSISNDELIVLITKRVYWKNLKPRNLKPWQQRWLEEHPGDTFD